MSDDTAPDSATDEPAETARDRVESALGEVRREGWKVATVYAVVDAAVVCLALNLLLVTTAPAWLPGRVSVPSAVAGPVADALGGPATLAVPGSATLAVGVGVVVGGAELGWRVRRPLVEQFEAANPPVRETLRTARDAVRDGADSEMAARLYEDTLDRLGESSGVALVDSRRVGATAAVVVVLSLVTVQAAVLDVGLLGEGGDDATAPDTERTNNYTGLLDGDQVLGDSTSVDVGEEELNASVESTGGGRDVGDDEQFPADSGPSAGAGTGGTDSQQAGFAAPEQVEDAELVREYNRRIRESDGDGDADSDPNTRRVDSEP